MSLIRVHHKLSTSDSWMSAETITTKLSYIFFNLRWETTYVFSVSALRPGQFGEGPRGTTSMSIMTLCDGKFRASRMGYSVKASLWCDSLLINTRFCFLYFRISNC